MNRIRTRSSIATRIMYAFERHWWAVACFYAVVTTVVIVVNLGE